MKLQPTLTLILFFVCSSAVGGELSLRYGAEFVLTKNSSYSSQREALLDFGLAYFLTRNIDAAVTVGLGKEKPNGGITSKVDLYGQFHFLSVGGIRPFGHAGFTYVAFSKENCSSQPVFGDGFIYFENVCETNRSSSYGPQLGIGTDIMLGQKRKLTLTLSHASGRDNLEMTLFGLAVNY